MDTTLKLIAKTLGASAVEAAGADARFAVEGADGGCLKISIEGRLQRVMGVLIDAAGVTRASFDLAPVSHVKDDVSFPGRVTLHVGKQLVIIDSHPTLAIEIVSKDTE
ncbi:MAG: hypothetical protein IPL61_34925 [Myxococcales bacterium]|nr:hypothetical protein [Myxococcales bacterium]